MSHDPGTLFVLRSSGFIGFAIRLLTRSPVNHAGVCVGGGATVEAEAAGAVSKTERVVSPDVLHGTALLARINSLSAGRGQKIADEAVKLLGTPYNFLDLVALGWATLHRDPTGPPEKPNWWQRRIMNNGWLICSQLDDLACQNAGVHLFTDGRLPGQVTPGDLQRVLADPDWKIVVDTT